MFKWICVILFICLNLAVCALIGYGDYVIINSNAKLWTKIIVQILITGTLAGPITLMIIGTPNLFDVFEI